MTQHAQFARLGLFDARTPRYTSYPTAPHFAPAIGPGDFTTWIKAIPEGAQISLYLHVPFCRRLCWFCACRTQGTTSDDPVRAYAQTLRTEIAALARHLPRGVTLSRMHWGGGTPTMLPPDDIRAVADAVAQVLPLAPGAEFSVEIDPNEVDDARIAALVAAGMNRASIGVQDFDPEIQQAIGRDQSIGITRDVADRLRAAGVAGLNCDILYGLPHQSAARMTESVQKLLSLSPDRVALYGYAHVPWMSRRQQLIPEAALPSATERLRLFQTARDLFEADGYQAIGIDHFARPHDGLAVAQQSGRLRRNFQGYTDDRANVLIGIGASSVSRFPQGYAQNAAATGAHVRAIREGRFSTARGHAFTPDDILRGRIIESLMCDFRVDRRDLVRTLGADPGQVDDLLGWTAAAFDGMVEWQDGVLRIPPGSRPLTRLVAQAFDAYDSPAMRHSVAT